MSIGPLLDAYKEFFDNAAEYAKIESTDYRNTYKFDAIQKQRDRARQKFIDSYRKLAVLGGDIASAKR